MYWSDQNSDLKSHQYRSNINATDSSNRVLEISSLVNTNVLIEVLQRWSTWKLDSWNII